MESSVRIVRSFLRLRLLQTMAKNFMVRGAIQFTVSRFNCPCPDAASGRRAWRRAGRA